MVRILMIAVVLMVANAAKAQMNNFPTYDLQKCHVTTMSGVAYELCAVSAPVGEKQRAFSLTVRDPTKLDGDSPASRNRAKHLLIAEQKVATKSGEYMHYGLVSPLELGPDTWIVHVQIVRGTPDDYGDARSVIYLFDVKQKKFSLAYESPVCAPKCKAQTLQARGMPGAPQKTITLQQTTAKGSKSYVFEWDGKQLSAPH